MSVLEDLIATRNRFESVRGNTSIQSAHYGACHSSETSLASLVALREALPPGFADFKQFETDRCWSRKKAMEVLDRAVVRALKTGSRS